MAQKKRLPLVPRVKSLMRRYGLSPARSVVLVMIVALVCVASVASIRMLGGTGLTIARSDEASAKEQAVAQADAQVNSATSSAPPEEQTPKRLLVHVDGAVASPGVYVVETDDPRINDAVELAGGILDNADTSAINLAAPVEDGQKIHVPTQGETPTSSVPPDGAGVLGSGTAGDGSLVNINTANAEELCSLPGVGEATAAAIVEERDSNGPFASAEDIMRVQGIGEKKFAKMQDKICV